MLFLLYFFCNLLEIKTLHSSCRKRKEQCEERKDYAAKEFSAVRRMMFRFASVAPTSSSSSSRWFRLLLSSAYNSGVSCCVCRCSFLPEWNIISSSTLNNRVRKQFRKKWEGSSTNPCWGSKTEHPVSFHFALTLLQSVVWSNGDAQAGLILFVRVYFVSG